MQQSQESQRSRASQTCLVGGPEAAPLQEVWGPMVVKVQCALRGQTVCVV